QNKGYAVRTTESATLAEVRLILIGGRWAGKSVSGNTILGKDRFECGRTRTTQTEVRHVAVQGRRLVVVDAPGWSHSLSLTEIPEGDKRRFKLNASRCPPGPHVFLLVVPVDSAFSAESKRTVEEHMKLLGERVWRHTMVLFTCGDFLGGKTIEQHIESEGESLRRLTERCRNRYHNADDGTQIAEMLEKITETVAGNGGDYFVPDGKIFLTIEERRSSVVEAAHVRKSQVVAKRKILRGTNGS
uniref:AIG1-type G domain-containing protein n=1 Tax=Cyclopterus lumpus TaxID=8103 RepID=A0A8C2W9X2_CYCLU